MRPKRNSPTSASDKEPLSEAEAWPRLLRYCAYQERSPAEVSQKMRTFKLDADAQARLLIRLQEENFLSADRFAQAYSTGKLRNNRWGERKIAQGLAAKGIDRETIAEKLTTLPANEVRQSLRTLLEKKDGNTYHKLPSLERKTKLYRLGISHGFGHDIVSEEVKRILKPQSEEDNIA